MVDSSHVKGKTLANITAWRMIELPDRSLAVLKEFTIMSSGQTLPVIVIVRSNGIALYRVRNNGIPETDARIVLFEARKLSLQNLSLYFTQRDAAECIAVFNFNRRSLLQVVSSKEPDDE